MFAICLRCVFVGIYRQSPGKAFWMVSPDRCAVCCFAARATSGGSNGDDSSDDGTYVGDSTTDGSDDGDGHGGGAPAPKRRRSQRLTAAPQYKEMSGSEKSIHTGDSEEDDY